MLGLVEVPVSGRVLSFFTYQENPVNRVGTPGEQPSLFSSFSWLTDVDFFKARLGNKSKGIKIEKTIFKGLKNLRYFFYNCFDEIVQYFHSDRRSELLTEVKSNSKEQLIVYWKPLKSRIVCLSLNIA